GRAGRDARARAASPVVAVDHAVGGAEAVRRALLRGAAAPRAGAVVRPQGDRRGDVGGARGGAVDPRVGRGAPAAAAAADVLRARRLGGRGGARRGGAGAPGVPDPAALRRDRGGRRRVVPAVGCGVHDEGDGRGGGGGGGGSGAESVFDRGDELAYGVKSE